MKKRLKKAKLSAKSQVRKKITIKEKKSTKKKVKKSKEGPSEVLVNEIIKGIQEKKGNQIVCLNLKKIDASVCDYFIICEGNSRTQVDAIARSVEEMTRKELKEKPYHSEGYENAEWIVIDYVNVVVHIFQRHIRDFYKLEDLWADAEVRQVA